MHEPLGRTTIRPVQFAVGMGDCDPAVAGMLVITGIVREAWLGRVFSRRVALRACRSTGSCTTNFRLRPALTAPFRRPYIPSHWMVSGWVLICQLTFRSFAIGLLT